MKLFNQICLVLTVIFLGVSRSHSQGNLTLYVQNDNGNTQLTLSGTDLHWASSSGNGLMGFGNNHADSLWQGPSNPNIWVSVLNFATITNTTTGQSAGFGGFFIWNISDLGTCFIFSFPAGIDVNTGDALQISPSPATVTVPLPFSDFIAGTVSTPAGSAFDVPFTMIVEPVPEPSSVAIIGMGLLASGLFYRRWL